VITCRELIDFIDSYLERELPDEQRASFEAHLRVCPSCVAYLGSYRTSIDLARSAHDLSEEDVAAEMPPELVAAILRCRPGAS
jgi:anti-sigma factor RsiW